ncbi:hypothetical protein JFN87_24820 [Streptomyces bomunensis]|uniref:Uncharacterized protein n=1 Tax=Streptomyces montanisoli TaxID=2798581 RepID=A0A940MJ60_9ACTN|nr:hypothetical protein [Streptomyces montanisoli]
MTGPAWAKSLTSVHRPCRAAADDHPPLHGGQFLRLVDDDVPVLPLGRTVDQARRLVQQRHIGIGPEIVGAAQQEGPLVRGQAGQVLGESAGVRQERFHEVTGRQPGPQRLDRPVDTRVVEEIGADGVQVQFVCRAD